MVRRSSQFQFTPLREGRHGVFDGGKRNHSISIHAPARGATRHSSSWHTRGQFQFTPLREGRRVPTAAETGTTSFQFTPLREGRRSGRRAPSQSRYFNSRPCERGDLCFLLLLWREAISIHAPARGATPTSPGEKKGEYFNSRPCERGDSIISQLYCALCRNNKANLTNILVKPIQFTNFFAVPC